MKYLYIFLLSAISFVAKAQTINIPDTNFKNALLNYTNPIIDINGDGEIQNFEAEAVHYLTVSFENINNLEGIVAFTNLESLNCSNNNIVNLDLTNNTNLTLVNCNDNNSLNTLNVTGLNLETLQFNNGHISNIDISSSTNLKTLYCKNNNLTALDLTTNNNLEKLDCSGFGNNLGSLDLLDKLDLKHLVCFSNQLTALTLPQTAPNLININCSNNPIGGTLNVSMYLNLDSLNCGTCNLDVLTLNNPYLQTQLA